MISNSVLKPWPLIMPEISLDPGQRLCLGSYFLISGKLELTRLEMTVTGCSSCDVQPVPVSSQYGHAILGVYYGDEADTPLSVISASVGQHASAKRGIFQSPGVYTVFIRNNTTQFILTVSSSLVFSR